MCSSYRDVGASGGFAGLVLPLSKCLVNQDSREEDFPPFIVRACRGLSWDTPVGFKLSKDVPAVMRQKGIC